MNIKTNYKEVRNEEKNGIELYFESIPTPEERTELKENGYKWHGVKKCWYRSENYTKTEKKAEKTEVKELKTLKKLNPEELEELAKIIWSAEDMQKYLINTYDFYKTNDGLIIELQKTNKIAIDREMWFDDETEAPEVTEKNFIIYNRSNVPGRNLEAYLEEKEKLENNGCASGRYDYNGIYFISKNYKHDFLVSCNWYDDEQSKRNIKRYLTEEETADYIELMKERKEEYIERLKKYFKRYGKHVHARGYWVNR